MGYGVYEDRAVRGRWAGYMVPAECDYEDCEERIDRGMGYRCEQYVDSEYIDENGEPCESEDDWVEEIEVEREGCELHFCGEHEPHHVHENHSDPTDDLPEWKAWIIAHPSWAEWHKDNPEKSAAYDADFGVQDIKQSWRLCVGCDSGKNIQRIHGIPICKTCYDS